MPGRASKQKKHRPEDTNEIAARVLGGITDLEGESKNPFALALGRLGASKGGQARAKKLSAAKRKRIAKKAAKARWQGGTDTQ